MADDGEDDAAISRRELVALGGLLALEVAGCGDDSRVSVGGLLDGGDTPFDLAPPPRDAAAGEDGGCTPRVPAGPAAALVIGDARLITAGSFTLYLCRDAGGLFAVSAICSHTSCVVRRQTARFYCPCHGATYDLNGGAPTAPALAPLDHYAVCVDPEGNAAVDVTNLVDPSVRA